MAKDGRFYLRLSDDERRMFDEVAEEMGFESASSAVRFIMRAKHRELFGDKPRSKKKKRKR